MANYLFSQITAPQALAIAAADTLVIDVGTAFNASVAYLPADASGPDRIAVTSGGRTVAFAVALAQVSAAGRLTVADGSALFVGDITLGDLPLALGPSNDAMFGGGGGDTLDAGGGTNILQGNQGDDSLMGGDGADTLYGGQNNDYLVVNATSTGRSTNFGQGNKGSDTIIGGADADTLLGGQDNDSLVGGPGNDFLNGNLGDDTITDSAGDDRIFGEAGNDRIIDSDGSDTVDGGLGDDSIALAGAGADSVSGGDGNDTIVAAEDNPLVISTFTGGAGNDSLRGQGARDFLQGDDGADTLEGGTGLDTLSGGAGADVFRILFVGEVSTSPATGSAQDLFIDWSSDDRLQFFFSSDLTSTAGSAANYREILTPTYAVALSQANALIAAGAVDFVAAQIGADVVLFADLGKDNVGADAAIYLIGRTLTDIDAVNII